MLSKLYSILSAAGYEHAIIEKYDGTLIDGFLYFYRLKDRSGDFYIYDIMEGDGGYPCSIRPYQSPVNHYGDFITYEKIEDTLDVWEVTWGLETKIRKKIEEIIEEEGCIGSAKISERNIVISRYFGGDMENEEYDIKVEIVNIDENNIICFTGYINGVLTDMYYEEFQPDVIDDLAYDLDVTTEMTEGYVDFYRTELENGISRKAFELIPHLPGIDRVKFNLLRHEIEEEIEIREE